MADRIFRFDAKGRQGAGKGKTAPDPQWGFSKPATSQPDPVVVKMLAEGMLPLPEPLQGLSRGELRERGYLVAKWHGRHKKRYVPIARKRHDT